MHDRFPNVDNLINEICLLVEACKLLRKAGSKYIEQVDTLLLFENPDDLRSAWEAWDKAVFRYWYDSEHCETDPDSVPFTAGYLQWLTNGYSLLETLVRNSPWRDDLTLAYLYDQAHDIRMASWEVPCKPATPWYEKPAYTTYRRIETLFPTPSE